MSIIGARVNLVSTEFVYDVNQGHELRQEWVGIYADLQSMAQAYAAVGLRCQLRQDEGALGRLSVGIPQSADYSQTETPQHKWTITTDFVQETLWNNPKVWFYAELDAAGLQLPKDEVLGFYRTRIDHALKGSVWQGADQFDNTGQYQQLSNGPLTPSQTGFTQGSYLMMLYKLMMRGAEAYEVERPVVSRVRTYSAQYLQRITIPSIPDVYTTTAFVRDWAVPAVIAAQLPDDPAHIPENCIWAWKERRHTAEVDYTGKVVETCEWTFAAWSTLLYNSIV